MIRNAIILAAGKSSRFAPATLIKKINNYSQILR